jgi:hypothetical protein
MVYRHLLQGGLTINNMHEIEIKLLKSRMIQTTAVEMQADPQLPTILLNIISLYHDDLY